MQATNTIFYIIILIMSVVIHEVCHGFTAEMFGDRTARDAGRLTLNPLKHLDLFGSIILPALLYFSSGLVFGWARPVPYNPNNLSNRRWGTVAVAAAGILANLFIALVFGIIIRVSMGHGLPAGFYFITSSIVIVNVALGLFNLIPIPPLDGSKILFALLPPSWYPVTSFLERYALVLIIIFIAFFSNSIYPAVAALYHAMTGLSF